MGNKLTPEQLAWRERMVASAKAHEHLMPLAEAEMERVAREAKDLESDHLPKSEGLPNDADNANQ